MPCTSAAVVLGFNSPSYTTKQVSQGLTVCVLLQKGQLQRPVTLSLKTSDITAVHTDTFPQDPLQSKFFSVLFNAITAVTLHSCDPRHHTSTHLSHTSPHLHTPHTTPHTPPHLLSTHLSTPLHSPPDTSPHTPLHSSPLHTPLPSAVMYDYIAVNTTLTFNSTTHSSCVTVTILDSYSYLMEVAFSVNITSADPSVVIPNPTVTVTIQGNNCEWWVGSFPEQMVPIRIS